MNRFIYESRCSDRSTVRESDAITCPRTITCDRIRQTRRVQARRLGGALNETQERQETATIPSSAILIAYLRITLIYTIIATNAISSSYVVWDLSTYS